MLRRLRIFFDTLDILEVDCPLLSEGASVDLHIDLIPSLFAGKEWRFLHSSPEHGMKRLLVDGIGDIYQMSHVFRDGECGSHHNPEFMLIEWYRLGFSFEEMIQETVDLINEFFQHLSYEMLSYQEAFLKYAGFDPFSITEERLRSYIIDKGLAEQETIANDDRDLLLNIILALVIEPNLGDEGITILHAYPASQAALAQTVEVDGIITAKRFEAYLHGVELANGYLELADAREQRKRYEEANEQRRSLGKGELPIDELFLQALKRGLPPCCGVAVGFDRLMMLRNSCKTIDSVIPFGWNEA
jgi:lysyl-tRNA synthetase class 2